MSHQSIPDCRYPIPRYAVRVQLTPFRRHSTHALPQVIGKGGSIVKMLNSTTGASIKISDFVRGAPRFATVKGPVTGVVTALFQIAQAVASVLPFDSDSTAQSAAARGAAGAVAKPSVHRGVGAVDGDINASAAAEDSKYDSAAASTTLSLTLVISNPQVGLLIGKGGVHIEALRRSSGATIRIVSGFDQICNTISIQGRAAAMTSALKSTVAKLASRHNTSPRPRIVNGSPVLEGAGIRSEHSIPLYTQKLQGLTLQPAGKMSPLRSPRTNQPPLSPIRVRASPWGSSDAFDVGAAGGALQHQPTISAAPPTLFPSNRLRIGGVMNVRLSPTRNGRPARAQISSPRRSASGGGQNTGPFIGATQTAAAVLRGLDRRPTPYKTNSDIVQAPDPVGTVCVIIPASKAGSLIGRKGATVQLIKAQSGAAITVSEYVKGAEFRSATIRSMSIEPIRKALGLILAQIEPRDSVCTLTLQVPPSALGNIIGKKGVRVNSIRQNTGATVQIEENGIVVMTGPHYNVWLAGSMIAQNLLFYQQRSTTRGGGRSSSDAVPSSEPRLPTEAKGGPAAPAAPVVATAAPAAQRDQVESGKSKTVLKGALAARDGQILRGETG